MQINITGNFKGLARLPEKINRQFVFAAPKALNDTAFKARENLQLHANQVFGRPVKRTVDAGMVERARRGQLWARVYLREDMKSGIQPGKYLKAEINSGARRDKRLERALKSTRIYTKKHGTSFVLPDEYFVVVHRDYANQKGNLTGARAKTILSEMKMNGRGGKYFLIHPDWPKVGDSGMTPDIYLRVGKKLKIVLTFIKKAGVRYRKRYKFYESVNGTVKNYFNLYYAKSLENAFRTMRI